VSDRDFSGSSFNEFLREEKLMASRCTGCGVLYLPPRPICPKCHGREMEWEQVKGEGKLATFTAIAVTSTLMSNEGYGRDNPNCVGIVELEEGVRISCRVLGVDTRHPEKIKVGTPVRMEFQHAGHGEEWASYLVFRPVHQPELSSDQMLPQR
jgi:uncharacterized OB-fold protein